MPGVGGIKAGRAFVLIEAVDRTGHVLSGIGNKLRSAAGEISTIGRTMAMRAAAAMIPLGMSVKAGTAFDDVMKKVESRSEGTGAELMALREQAKALGRESSFTATHIAKMQDMLAQKGYNRGQIKQMTEPIMDLARAGGEGVDLMQDAALSAKLVSGTMQAYQMGAEKTAEVSDMMAVALNASNFTLEELVTSLQYAAPAAKLFNVPLNETLAILSAMRDVNIDPSIAGTAFRNILLYMSQAKEQEDFNAELKAATGNTIEFTDALDNLKSPMVLLPALMKATEGMGTSGKSDLLRSLLEMRAVMPGAAVGDMVESMGKMLMMLEKAQGAAKRTASIMDSGLGGAFRRFMGTVNDIAIRLTEALTPALMTVTQWIKTAGTDIGDWISKNSGLVTTLAAAVVGFLALGGALIVIGQVVGVLGTIAAFAGSLMTAAAGIAAFAAPWAIAAAGVYLLDQAITGLTGATLMDSFPFLKEWGDYIAGDLTAAFKSLQTTSTDAAQHLAKDWGETMSRVMDSFARGDIQGAMELMWNQIQVTWQEGLNKLSDMIDEWQRNWMIMKTASGDWAVWFFENIMDYGNAPADPNGNGPREFLESLKEAQKGRQAEAMNDPELAGRKAAREEKLRGLREKLEADKIEADREKYRAEQAKKWEMEGEGALQGWLDSVKESTAQVNKIRADADKAIGMGAMTPTAKMAPKALEGIERDSVEAARTLQEMRNNTQEAALDQQKEMNNHLAAIERNTQDMVGAV